MSRDYPTFKNINLCSCFSDAVHGDELAYIFGAPLVQRLDPFRSKYTESERTLSRNMITYFSNFFKTGYRAFTYFHQD